MISFELIGFDVFDDLRLDAFLLQDLADDPQFRNDIQEIIGENFELIWNTRGGAIGADWNGNDLVDTGALRNSMVNSPSFTIVGDTIIFNAGTSYGVFVNDMYEFMDITKEARSKLDNAVINYLIRNGKFNWS